MDLCRLTRLDQAESEEMCCLNKTHSLRGPDSESAVARLPRDFSHKVSRESLSRGEIQAQCVSEWR